jgi:exonuclease III
MLTNNMDVTDGLTNGAMGTVTYVALTNTRVSTILVKFDNNHIGTSALTTSKFKHICKKSIPITRIQQSFYINGKKSAEVMRTQYPLMLSWAVTIHKVQGLTLPNVVVDMAHQKGAYGYGQAYVALSRVKTLSSLHIINYTRLQIKADPQVNTFMEEMIRKSIPPLEIQHNQSCSNGLRIAHQNVENCKSNQLDIDQHETLQQSDIVCLTETHLQQGTLWPLQNINCDTFTIYRLERQNMSGGGIAICVRNPLGAHCIAASNIITCEFIHIVIHTYTPIHIICCYKRPITPLNDFTQILANYLANNLPMEEQTIIMGDFNNDLLDKHQSTVLIDTLGSLGFNQTVQQFTTDRGTLIDHVYIKHANLLKTTVDDCYYSYHDTISINIDM